MGGSTDVSCKRIFRDAAPPAVAITDDTAKQIKSMIPDLVVFSKNLPAEESSLGGANHLIDLKTLAAGLAYKTNSGVFGHAVAAREAQVNKDYHSTARRLDSALHGTRYPSE